MQTNSSRDEIFKNVKNCCRYVFLLYDLLSRKRCHRTEALLARHKNVLPIREEAYMTTIKSLVVSNFKRFPRLELKFDEKRNILIGDNEAGKSSVLLAIDLVLSGSRSKVETIGLETLFHKASVDEFLEGPKTFDKLPKLYIEAYLSDEKNSDLNGKNNSNYIKCNGIRLDCEPIADYSKDIMEVLKHDQRNFPFEFYSIKFITFSGEAYTGFRKFIKHLVIDSSQISNDYATREYTKSVYSSSASVIERSKHENAYRMHKSAFRDGALADVNDKLETYKFGVRSSPKSNLESDIVITENGISIENKGKGKQCFIKTEFALQRNQAESRLDLLLLEEPENHLSHGNMKKLIQRIGESSEKQLLLATHSSLISSRLDLRKAIILSPNSMRPTSLSDLDPDTAKFFMKAPDNNVLEFILSKKVLLVEGDSEFILLDTLYKTVSGSSTLDADNVHVISVDGTSFKRYLDLAKLLGIKTAVIRDNDGDYDKNCLTNYAEYVANNIRVFSDKDRNRNTFEVCFYQDNVKICDQLFGTGRKSLTVLEYMLGNKTQAAFELLDKKEGQLVCPCHIREAIEWIRE